MLKCIRFHDLIIYCKLKVARLLSIMSPELLRLNRENPHIDMLIPKEGSFYIIDAIAIPQDHAKR